MNITKVGHFSGHRNSIYSLIKGLKANTFYSGASDGFVVQWNTVTKGDGLLLVNVTKPVYSLLLLASKNELLIGTASGNMHVIDLSSNKEVRNIEAHQQGVFDLQLFGNQLISAGEDGFIKLWNPSDFSCIQEIKASEKSARVIAIHPHKPEFAVGFSDHKIRIYNKDTFELKQVLDGHTNSVFALNYSPDGKYLLSGGRDAMLKIHAPENRFQTILEIPAHTLHINAISFSPNGKLFATVSMDKTLKIWDVAHFELLKVIDKIKNDAHISSVNKMFWVDNQHILTCSDDKMIMMWKLELESD